MKKYDNFVIMTDMDGTLINTAKQVSDRNKAAIYSFTQNGGSFGVATGRTQNNCTPFMEGLAINAPCILYNGGVLFDWQRQKFIKTNYLESENLIEFIETCQKACPTLCVQIYTQEQLYIVSKPANHDAVILLERQDFKQASLKSIASIPWVKILLCDKQEVLLYCRKISEELGLQDQTLNFFSSPTYLEFVGKSVSKGHMLQEMRQLPQYKNKLFIAAGDFHNDIEMLKRADWGIASGNAEAEVKAASDQVGVTCDEDLLAMIIEQVIPSRFSV